MKKTLLLLSSLLLFIGCSKDDDTSTEQNTITENMYFPPIGSDNWETKTPASLNWNENNIQDLLDFLVLKNTKSFIVLHNGKIVMENYFNGHTSSTPWYWASAGKTLTTATTGIAQQEGFININNKVSDYIGTGWTSAPLAKENLITCKHLLTMTSGLDDEYNNDINNNLNNECITSDCLIYNSDAGTRWAYDNVYVKLQDVVSSATGQSWSNYFNSKLKNKIGMTGFWGQVFNNSVYSSNTRSMARFGLLTLNNGNWDGEQIINQTYLNQAVTTSQNINLAYGYMWWLNGKSSFHLPQTQFEFQGELIPNAPEEMYCALGKDDQKLYIVPSKKLVIVRMGDPADDSQFAVTNFDNELWQKINAVIN